MSDQFLLPVGFADRLALDAQQLAQAQHSGLQTASRFGYQLVQPAICEFEETLLAGTGASLKRETFRLMDPASGRMMGVRADLTTQIARIANVALRDALRPLRLCYAGTAIRQMAKSLQPHRQIEQLGAELIGASAPYADQEIITVALQILSDLGIGKIVVDLNVPRLRNILFAHYSVPQGSQPTLTQAIAMRQFDAIPAEYELIHALLNLAGPRENVLEKLQALPLPDDANILRDNLCNVARALADVDVYLDPLGAQGFDYYTGLCFTLLSAAAQQPLGRGGRYQSRIGDEAGEDATGFTIDLDLLQALLPVPVAAKRIYLPVGTSAAVEKQLQAEGWITIRALQTGDEEEIAAQLGCIQVWQNK